MVRIRVSQRVDGPLPDGPPLNGAGDDDGRLARDDVILLLLCADPRVPGNPVHLPAAACLSPQPGATCGRAGRHPAQPHLLKGYARQLASRAQGLPLEAGHAPGQAPQEGHPWRASLAFSPRLWSQQAWAQVGAKAALGLTSAAAQWLAEGWWVCQRGLAQKHRLALGLTNQDTANCIKGGPGVAAGSLRPMARPLGAVPGWTKDLNPPCGACFAP